MMTEDDLDFMTEMLGDPEVMRFYPKVCSREEALESIKLQLTRYARDGHGFWLLIDRAKGLPIGRAGLVIQEVEGAKEPEVGYMVHRPYWRQGYATEAARAVRDHALTALKKPYIISLIRPENVPSQGVARKLGMQPTRSLMFHGFLHQRFMVSRDTD